MKIISRDMQIKEVTQTLERFAPLPLQESYDNAGLQIGLTGAQEVSGVLLCLDVTEDVVDEAERKGCNMIVAHHPLLFRGVKCVDGRTQVTRCMQRAIQKNIAIYAAHTNLDNAPAGVNFRIAEKLNLQDTEFLQPLPDGQGGSGIIGNLPKECQAMDFLKEVKEIFGIECLMHNNGPQRPVKRIALCGGAGDFLIDEAIEARADVFLTGEMGYHRYFGHESEIWIGVLGHYQSEQYTIQLLRDILSQSLPSLPLFLTEVNTNPIQYL